MAKLIKTHHNQGPPFSNETLRSKWKLDRGHATIEDDMLVTTRCPKYVNKMFPCSETETIMVESIRLCLLKKCHYSLRMTCLLPFCLLTASNPIMIDELSLVSQEIFHKNAQSISFLQENGIGAFSLGTSRYFSYTCCVWKLRERPVCGCGCVFVCLVVAPTHPTPRSKGYIDHHRPVEFCRCTYYITCMDSHGIRFTLNALSAVWPPTNCAKNSKPAGQNRPNLQRPNAQTCGWDRGASALCGFFT